MALRDTSCQPRSYCTVCCGNRTKQSLSSFNEDCPWNYSHRDISIVLITKVKGFSTDSLRKLSHSNKACQGVPFYPFSFLKDFYSTLTAREGPKKTLDQYLLKMVTWKTGMKKKQRLLMVFFFPPQSLIIDLGYLVLWVGGPLAQEQ